jgi:hypothetical protein
MAAAGAVDCHPDRCPEKLYFLLFFLKKGAEEISSDQHRPKKKRPG